MRGKGIPDGGRGCEGGGWRVAWDLCQVETLLLSNYFCFSVEDPLKMQEVVCVNTQP